MKPIENTHTDTDTPASQYNKLANNWPLWSALLLGAIAYAPLFLFPGHLESIWNMVSMSLTAGIVAFVALSSRGYGVGIPIVVWLLFGWNVILGLFIFLGPLMLLIVALLPNRK